MIELKIGDIFEEDVEALVNSVNCVGVMGRGIALQFKNRFPDNFKAYAQACKRDEVKPGRMFIHESGTMTNPRYIVNFPTKRHWRGKSRMEDIEAGLADLAREVRRRQIRSIAIPPLGSSLGGLDWSNVRPRIEATLEGLNDVKIVVFEPGGGPSDNRPNRSTDVPQMTRGRAAVIVLMNRYVRGLLDPFVTLLEIHKLLYFTQGAGEDLRLQFKKARYGPYAENLRHVLHRMEGHHVMGYRDGGDSPGKRLDLVPGAVEEAEKFLRRFPETQERLTKVFELVDGFESSFGLELLSTVHWIADEEAALSDDEIISHTYAWGRHKRQFSERQIRLALEVLRANGWIGVQTS